MRAVDELGVLDHERPMVVVEDNHTLNDDPDFRPVERMAVRVMNHETKRAESTELAPLIIRQDLFEKSPSS